MRGTAGLLQATKAQGPVRERRTQFALYAQHAFTAQQKVEKRHRTKVGWGVQRLDFALYAMHKHCARMTALYVHNNITCASPSRIAILAHSAQKRKYACLPLWELHLLDPRCENLPFAILNYLTYIDAYKDKFFYLPDVVKREKLFSESPTWS